MKIIKLIKSREQGESPCQNCGKMVTVFLPFYGCVFCSDCITGESYETADASEFKRKWDDNEILEER